MLDSPLQSVDKQVDELADGALVGVAQGKELADLVYEQLGLLERVAVGQLALGASAWR